MTDFEKIILNRRSVRTFEPKALPQDVLDGIENYAASLTNPWNMKRYVKWFKSHGFGTNEIKNSWGEHMDLSHISGYSKDVAYAYIDSIYKSL